LSSYFTAANAKKAYLITYNAVSAAAWAYVLLYTTLHLVGLLHITPPVQITAKAAAATTFQRVIAKLPFTSSLFSSPLDNAKAKIYSSVPPALVPLLNRAKTLYPVIGPQLAFIQSFAVLELVHVLTGLVRSPLITTGMQVSSRLILIWEVAERFEEVRDIDFMATGSPNLTLVAKSPRLEPAPFSRPWFLHGQ
jgi:very-long-chain (3R)-3-hydroxyacyl-CoA dehydratase